MTRRVLFPFDLRPRVDATGDVPAPRIAQVAAFVELAAERLGLTRPLVSELLDAFERATPEQVEALMPAIVELCSGRPSAEQLAALTFELRQCFAGAVIGTVLEPLILLEEGV